jgi:pilus assembly protein Flp/PilA
MVERFRRLAADARGATAIEYAIIASGVAVVISAVVYNLGTSLNGLYTSVLAGF